LGLYGQIAPLEAHLRALLAASEKPEMSRPRDSCQVVLIEEAAKRLATSEDTLYTKWRKLPFAFKDPLDGKIKFRVNGIDEYIASRTH
jgi:hypothetical protein